MKRLSACLRASIIVYALSFNTISKAQDISTNSNNLTPINTGTNTTNTTDTGGGTPNTNPIASGRLNGNVINNIDTNIQNFKQQLGKLANQAFQTILSIFAYPNSDYITYLNSKVLPQDVNSAANVSLVGSQVIQDTNAFLQHALGISNTGPIESSAANQVTQTQVQGKGQQYVGSFNSGSILNHFTLSTTQEQKNAQAYIDFSSGAVMPLQTEGLLGIQLGTRAANNYLVQLGIYAAQLGAGTNALYQLYEERMPQKTLKNKSALEYEAEMINSRSQPDWYAKITSTNFTPADVARESLILQQLQLRETFLLRLQLESIVPILVAEQQTVVQNTTKNAVSTAQANALRATASS